VSQACLGTMTWGEQNTEAEAHAQLDRFVTAGGTFVDTAEMYPVPPSPEVIGRTELYIGRWLKAHPEKRKDIVLASKVAGPRFGGWIRGNRKPEYSSHMDDTSTFNTVVNAEQIHEAIDSSLQRLQTDYLDLYQIHWPDRCAPTFGRSCFLLPADGHQLVPDKTDFATFEEQVKAMGELIKLGKIRHWGLSNETSYGVMMFCHTADRLGVPRPVSVQNDFSLVDRRFETELAEVCFYMKVSLMAYGPLAGGALSGKYTTGFERCGRGNESRSAEDSRHKKFPKFQSRYHNLPTLAAAKSYCELAQSKSLTPSALALAWCLTRTYISDIGVVIFGGTTMDQLEENMDALATVKLDADTVAAIDRIHRANPNPNVDQYMLD